MKSVPELIWQGVDEGIKLGHLRAVPVAGWTQMGSGKLHWHTVRKSSHNLFLWIIPACSYQKNVCGPHRNQLGQTKILPTRDKKAANSKKGKTGNELALSQSLYSMQQHIQVAPALQATYIMLKALLYSPTAFFSQPDDGCLIFCCLLFQRSNMWAPTDLFDQRRREWSWSHRNLDGDSPLPQTKAAKVYIYFCDQLMVCQRACNVELLRAFVFTRG